jgi:hypothetical protein
MLGEMKIKITLALTVVASGTAFSPSHTRAQRAPTGRLPPVGSPGAPRPAAAAHDDDADGTSSPATSLYDDVPANKPWTLGILTSGFPPQQLLVPVVKFVTFQVWRLMMNELTTHDADGRFVRESFQAGNDPSPLDLPAADATGPRYKLYLGTTRPRASSSSFLRRGLTLVLCSFFLRTHRRRPPAHRAGNPCPWCHRVKAALALLDLEGDIPVTTLIDNAEKASKGGVSGFARTSSASRPRFPFRAR